MLRILRRAGPVPCFVLAGLVAVAAVFILTGAVKKGVRPGPKYEMDRRTFGYLDVGNFWNKIWNQMFIGDQEGDHSGEWPGGSGINYVYIGNLWFGTLIGSDIHVSGDFPYLGSAEWHEIGLSENELLMSNKANWKNKPDYVKEMGDLDTYAICDDSDAGEKGPIPVIAEMHAVQWSAPGHDDWIVLECWIRNKNTARIENCYVSLAYDLDIGGSLDYIDDLVGYDGNDSYDIYTNPTAPGVPWDPASIPDGIPDENDAVNFTSSSATRPLNKETNGFKRMLDYMYDSGGESRDTPGYCGLRVMGWMDGSSQERRNETLIEFSSQHSWDIMNDPDTDAYKYGYMIDEGIFEEINTPYDWRIDPVFGAFELEPEEVVHWYTGVIMGGDLLELRQNADALYADFLGIDGLPGTDDDWQVVSPPASPRLVGVRGDSTVTLRWNPNYAIGKNTETDADPRTKVVDFDGYIVWRSNVGFDTGWVPILWVDKLSTSPSRNFAWGWRQGQNMKPENPLRERVPEGPPKPGTKPKPGQSQTDPDLRNAPAATYESITGKFPTKLRKPVNGRSSIRLRKVGDYYELVDGVDGSGALTRDLANGTRYYYAVVAYDFGNKGKPANFLPTMGGKNVNALAIIPISSVRNVLDDIRVVPNPYKGSADWEEWTGSGARLGKLYFMNLPAKCTIRIYTIAGDLVRTLEHNDVASGAEPWDLTGEAGVQVASGIYVYHVDAPEHGEKIGKFAVLVGRQSQ